MSKEMEEIKERFEIKITEKGMDILSADGAKMSFTPLDALMLLEILRSEEKNLRQMADDTSPLPLKLG